MSDISPTKPPLEVGALIQQSISLTFRKPMLIVGAGVVLYGTMFLASLLIFGSLQPFSDLAGSEDVRLGFSFEVDSLQSALFVMLILAATAFFNAVLSIGYVSLIRDSWAGIGATAMAGAMRTGHVLLALVLFILVIVAACAPGVLVEIFGNGVVAMLVILAGLAFCAARFMVMVPVAAIEGTLYKTLSRSAELSQGYRGPLLGAYVLVLLLLVVIGLVVGVVIATLTLAGPAGMFIGQLANAVLSTYSYALMAAFFSVAYARLTDIKEGLADDGTADIFS